MLSEYETKEKQGGKMTAFPFSKKSHPSYHYTGLLRLKDQIIKSSPSESSTFSSCIESDYTQAPTRGNSCSKTQKEY